MLTSVGEVETKPTIAVALCFFFGYAGFKFFRARINAAPDTTNDADSEFSNDSGILGSGFF